MPFLGVCSAAPEQERQRAQAQEQAAAATEASKAQEAEIVAQDADIDSVQQASIEADRVLLDMRRERRELGLSACGSRRQ